MEPSCASGSPWYTAMRTGATNDILQEQDLLLWSCGPPWPFYIPQSWSGWLRWRCSHLPCQPPFKEDRQQNMADHQGRGPNNNAISGTYIRPFLVGDAAFPFSNTMVKCFDDRHAPSACTIGATRAHLQFSLDTHQKSGWQAFGRLKGRFRILDGCDLRNPVFTADAALSSCALHNSCEA
eukprot:scpid86659/ scgid9769/ 